MNLLSLLPMLGLNIPMPVMSVGIKLLQTPGIFKDGALDVDFALAQLPAIVKDDVAVTKSVVKIGLQGVGVAPAAADLAVSFAFDSDGERSDEETNTFTAQFRYLNSPEGRIELPYGCASCKRIHYSRNDVKLSASGKPICARCSREIPL